MLILTRKVGESIRIGDDVEILVAGTNGVAVKLGVEAPKNIQVHRRCMSALPQFQPRLQGLVRQS